MLNRRVVVALATLLTACVRLPPYRELLQQTEAPPTLVIRDVSVFTALSPTLLEHHDVFVKEGIITAVEPTSSRPADTVIDGTGKTLMPGLVDLHVHTTTQSAPPWYLAAPNPKHNVEAFLYSGITTVNDLGGDLLEVAALRNDILLGKQPGPRIFFAGPIITHTGAYPISLLREGYGELAVNLIGNKLATQVSSAKEAREAVKLRLSGGATIIKVVIASIPAGAPQLTDDELDAVVTEAHAVGLKVIAHIDTAQDALRAAAHHVDALGHGVITTALTEEQAESLYRSGIVMVPTLINYERFSQIAQKRYTPLSLTQSIEPKELLEQFAPSYVDSAKLGEGLFKWGDAIEANVSTRPQNALTAFKAGVPVLAGSDAMGSVGTFASDLHQELKMLVDAGLPVFEVLQAATVKAARFLSERPHFGSIEVGKSADLLLLDGNPLDDVTNTQRLSAIIARGRVVKRVSGP